MNRIFCKNCKYCYYGPPDLIGDDYYMCTFPHIKYVNSVGKKVLEEGWQDCFKKNEKYNCKDFKKISLFKKIFKTIYKYI